MNFFCEFLSNEWEKTIFAAIAPIAPIASAITAILG